MWTIRRPRRSPINAEAFVEWAAEHLLHPLIVYTAYPGDRQGDQGPGRRRGRQGASELAPIPGDPAHQIASRLRRDATAPAHEGDAGQPRDLDKVGTPHFAQFVPLEDNQIGFFTVYDGSFDKYIADFTKNIGEVFDLIFKFTKDAAAVAVQKTPPGVHRLCGGGQPSPDRLLPGLSGPDRSGHQGPDRRQQGASSWIDHRQLDPIAKCHERVRRTCRERDTVHQQPRAFLHRLFGRGTRRHRHGVLPVRRQDHLDLDDIQGFILRGYRMPIVRHFLLKVDVPAAARKLLGRLVSGDEADAPQITTAKDWHVGFEPGPGDNPAEPPRRKPDYCLNLGITWPGLLALEVKDRVPTSRSSRSTRSSPEPPSGRNWSATPEPSGPQNWIGGFGTGNDHVLLTLHAISPEALTTYSDRLSALLAEGDAFPGDLARRRHGADGDAGRQAGARPPRFTSATSTASA